MMMIKNCCNRAMGLTLANSTAQRSFSSSAAPMVSTKALRFLKSQRIRQKNEAKQASLEDSLDIVDPVLGRPETPFIVRIMAELKEPGVLVDQYNKQEVEKLISLAELTKQEEKSHSLGDEFVSSELSGNSNLNNKETTSGGESSKYIESLENRKEAMLRILNLKNASNEDRLKLAIAMAREEFQRVPGDTGSSEVQAAIATVRIHMMAQHCRENKKDFQNIRNLRILVQQRQSMLKYLKTVDPKRYYWAITKLGLSDLSVIREFNLDKQYMQDYDFFGDGKQLVKESKKVASQRRKEERKKKKRTENLSVQQQQQQQQQQSESVL